MTAIYAFNLEKRQVNQFDIYVNPVIKGRKRYPYVCSLQNKLFDGLTTRIVAFVCRDESIAFDKISVPITISSNKYFVCLNVLATIEESRLQEFVENISDCREALLAAHDALISGI